MTTEAAGRLGSIGMSVWQMGRNAALGTAEYFTPVLTESAFAEKGVLTPEEFVAAGDMLVLRCPTWQWQAGDPKQARPFLPPDKQFLLTRNVPCQKRAATLGAGCNDEEDVEAEGDEGWVRTHGNHSVQTMADDDAPDMVADATAGMATATIGEVAAASEAASSEAALEVMGADDDDEGTLVELADANIVKTRTYDVSISYDKYYQCARVWLYGYTESRQPLTQEQILEDISADHALKTVTLEAHPHIASGAGLHASIHPCKHASVMQKLCSELKSSGRDVRADSYLFLFLKFISCVIPTVEYDYTLAVDGL